MAARKAAASSSKAPVRPVLLRGRIDELSYLCSSAGIGLAGGSLPATVSKISLGSAAAYSGLKEGDKVVKAETGDDVIVLTVERAGKQYQARVAVNVHGLRSEFESRKARFSFGDSPFDKELTGLRDCDVVIMLDRCGSMNDRNAGCPGDVSKWTWCRNQIDNLYVATSRVLDSGFDLVLFNDSYQTYKAVNLWDLKQVFDRVGPAGSRKDISRPLESVLNDHFSKPGSAGRTCLVLVLTDGTQNVGPALQDVLIEASRKMTGPGRIMVVFLQVGESIIAEELLHDLDRNLVAKGALYHLVSYRPFSAVRNKGLLFELLQAMHEARQAQSGQRRTLAPSG
ncbi:MAG TPA: hypothetical protein V6D08_14715 [Candidatus Obscuribacterales bacterium]